MWTEIQPGEVQQPGGDFKMDRATGKSYRWVDDPQPSISERCTAITGLRSQVWANDYRPVAVSSVWHPRINAGKAPVELDWPEGARQNPPAAVVEGANYGEANTGILCDELRPVDI